MPSKITITLSILLYSLHAVAQSAFKLTELDSAKIPKQIKYTGSIKNAVRWMDRSGDNIVITTETGEKPSAAADDDSYRDAALYAYHFIISGDSVKLTWKLYDFIKQCPLDIEANFIKNSFLVTDLNKDNTAEVWLMYKIVCHGDVSPSEVKIIMYQGKEKFAMRGQSKVKVSEKEFEGGKYQFDQAFTDGPAPFREFAKNMWNKEVMSVGL